MQGCPAPEDASDVLYFVWQWNRHAENLEAHTAVLSSSSSRTCYDHHHYRVQQTLLDSNVAKKYCIYLFIACCFSLLYKMEMFFWFDINYTSQNLLIGL